MLEKIQVTSFDALGAQRGTAIVWWPRVGEGVS